MFEISIVIKVRVIYRESSVLGLGGTVMDELPHRGSLNGISVNKIGSSSSEVSPVRVFFINRNNIELCYVEFLLLLLFLFHDILYAVAVRSVLL